MSTTLEETKIEYIKDEAGATLCEVRSVATGIRTDVTCSIQISKSISGLTTIAQAKTAVADFLNGITTAVGDIVE